MAIVNYHDLAKALLAAPLTMAQIAALDPASGLCSMPANAVQGLRSMGYQIAVTTDPATGAAKYQVMA